MPYRLQQVGGVRVNDMEDQKKEQELHKSMECVKCKHLFDCKGKPREIDKCLNFEERKDR